MKKEETKKTDTQKGELENLLKRLQADFDNYRKRTEQERIEIRKSANADLILRLLPVLDNFKRAASHAPENDNWATGVKAIENQFEDVLRQAGLEQISAEPGATVDLTKHEVISQEESDQESGRIVKCAEVGYTLNGKVLKPVKVIVSA